MIVLMMSFARSGGTIVNRCLGSMSDVVMLSELNALGGGWGAQHGRSPTTVQEQALRWYGISLRTAGFVDGILELEHICSREGRQLIVRDWTHVNFVPSKINGERPLRRLETLRSLAGHTDVRPFALVRNCVDMWLSFGPMPAETLLRSYGQFLDELEAHRVPVYKYEDFCAHPLRWMRGLCQQLGVPFDQRFLARHRGFSNVSGDTQNGRRSRGIRQGIIKPLPPRVASPSQLTEARRCALFEKANRRLGYPTNLERHVPAPE